MKRLIISSLLTSFILLGCSSKKEVPDIPASQLYSQAQTQMNSGNWIDAIAQLEALDSRYPFGAYSKQVQLDLIYSYYKNNNIALTLASIDHFIRLNPTSDKMDWILYMRGLSHMEQDRTFSHDLLNIDRSDRDPEPAKKAFRDFKQLIITYPKSQYNNDAKSRMVFLKNRLANYELAIVNYYIRRGAWIAAIDRGQDLLSFYSDTKAAREVLPYMLTAYNKLGLKKPASRIEKLINNN